MSFSKIPAMIRMTLNSDFAAIECARQMTSIYRAHSLCKIHGLYDFSMAYYASGVADEAVSFNFLFDCPRCIVLRQEGVFMIPGLTLTMRRSRTGTKSPQATQNLHHLYKEYGIG